MGHAETIAECGNSNVPFSKLASYTPIYDLKYLFVYIEGVPGGKVNILGGHSIGHSEQKVHMYMCPIPNGYQDRYISLNSSQIFDKKEILRTASNTGIYCSSDKVDKVYLLQYIFENSTVDINALCNSCEDMAFCSSDCNLTFHYRGDNIHRFISETARSRTHTYFFLE
jgi:hypothetical protein